MAGTKQYMHLSVPTESTVSTVLRGEPNIMPVEYPLREYEMFEILSAVFGVVIVGGAAALAYAIYLTSGFPNSERRHSGRSL
jgi:hypothetical protein